MILSRWERTNDNQDVIDLLFDFNTIQVGYKGNATDFEAWKNFIQPALDKKAKSYTIQKASVYGGAYYDDRWKRIRVMKKK